MRTADLCRELSAATSLSNPLPWPEDENEEVERMGIYWEVFDVMVGYQSIMVEGGRYQPDAKGVAAYITPVVELHGGDTEQIADRHSGETVDLVAWHPAHPERWALRTGVGRTLGYVAWWQTEKPTRVWRSPLAWLRARCDGIVLLTDDVGERHSILMQLRAGILAEDRRHAAELRAICERPYPVPRIGVM